MRVLALMVNSIIRFLEKKEAELSKRARQQWEELLSLTLTRTKRNTNFFHSQRWRALRYEAFRRYGKRCSLCGTEKATFHVDHIKPRSFFPELEYDIENLQILCRDCNLGKSNKDQTDWRKPTLDLYLMRRVDSGSGERNGDKQKKKSKKVIRST